LFKVYIKRKMSLFSILKIKIKSWVPNDPSYNNQWGFPKIGAPNAWEMGFRGSPNLITSVHDGGIRYTHDDLKNNM